jgi:hypothetical protein
MNIFDPLVSGSLSVSGSAQISGSLTVLGNISGITSNALTSSYVEYNNVANKPSLISGSGTLNYIPKFTGPNSLGNSLIFDNGSNVGIGTTSPDLGKLQLSGVNGVTFAIKNTTPTTAGTEFSQIVFNSTSNANANFESAKIKAVSTNGGANLANLIFENSGLERLRITSGGNVGIGTATFVFSPKTAIASVGENTLAIQTTDAVQGSAGTVLYIGTGASTGNSTYGVIRALGDGGTVATRLVLQPSVSDGNVLIGTTTDNGSKLQVNGDITANNIFLSGSVINLATDSTWSTYKTIISPGALQASRTYLISVQWNFTTVANNPYYCYTSFLFQAVSTNGTGTVNEITPICSNHVGFASMTMSFRSISGTASTSGLQAQLNNFSTFVGNITVKYILLE